MRKSKSRFSSLVNPVLVRRTVRFKRTQLINTIYPSLFPFLDTESYLEFPFDTTSFTILDCNANLPFDRERWIEFNKRSVNNTAVSSDLRIFRPINPRHRDSFEEEAKDGVHESNPINLINY